MGNGMTPITQVFDLPVAIDKCVSAIVVWAGGGGTHHLGAVIYSRRIYGVPTTFYHWQYR
jgi:hypothetical protein